MPETWAFVAASFAKPYGLPQPSFCGNDLMYVGESLAERAPYVTSELGQVNPPPAAEYEFASVARASHEVAMVRMSAMLLFCFERCIAVNRFGIAMAARMPMIATTISSSMRVKPFWC